jgi:hypothetical protein
VPIRLAIVGLPRLLADLIADVFSGDDAVRVDLLPDDYAAAVTATGSLRHDVIIIGVADPWRSPLLNLISGVTRPKVLGVRTDGRESWVYRMQPSPQRLGTASPAQIRAAVLSDPRTIGMAWDSKGSA